MFKKIIILLCSMVFATNMLGALPIFEALLGNYFLKKFMPEAPKRKQKQFWQGVLFNNIWRIMKNPDASITKLEYIELKNIYLLSLKSPFHAGKLFQVWVNKQKEIFFLSNKAPDILKKIDIREGVFVVFIDMLIEEVTYKIEVDPYKFIDDEVNEKSCYEDRMLGWGPLSVRGRFSYDDNPLEKPCKAALNFHEKITKVDINSWFDWINFYLNKTPSSYFAFALNYYSNNITAYTKQIDMNLDDLETIKFLANSLPELSQSKEVQEYVLKLYEHFRCLFGPLFEELKKQKLKHSCLLL